LVKMLSKEKLIELSSRLMEPGWFLKKRLEALKKFNELEMPSLKYGIGISVDLSDLDISKINPLEISDSNLIVSPEGIEVMTLSEAMEKYPEIIEEHFLAKSADSKENKLTAMHASFFSWGVFIKIPENTNPVKPVQININLDSKSKLDSIFIIAGRNSSAVIIENSESGNVPGQIFRSHQVEIVVGKNASIDYVSVQNLGKSVYNFCARKASVGAGGSVNWVDCDIGGKFTQAQTLTNLVGIRARSTNQGIVFGDKEQCFDINSATIHSVSETTSDMMTRVVLNNRAKAVYRGLIKIEPGASNCEGYQKDDTILLSDDAQADVVPNLEIKNNEVKCSHGATISQIDEDKIFYMASRGIDGKTAKKSIVEGFFHPIIEKIKGLEIEGNIVEGIYERLEAVN